MGRGSEATGEALGPQCSAMENAAGPSIHELLQGLAVGKLSTAEGSLPSAAGLSAWLSGSFLAGCWSRGVCALVRSAGGGAPSKGSASPLFPWRRLACAHRGLPAVKTVQAARGGGRQRRGGRSPACKWGHDCSVLRPQWPRAHTASGPAASQQCKRHTGNTLGPARMNCALSRSCWLAGA